MIRWHDNAKIVKIVKVARIAKIAEIAKISKIPSVKFSKSVTHSILKKLTL